MALLTNMPTELFRTILSEVVEAKPVLPDPNKWTDARLRLAARKELRRRQNLRPCLQATRAIRRTVIDLYYWKASFVFMDLDELRIWIELIPAEAKNHPISIEVGLWGTAPAKTWTMAKSLNIHNLTLVIHPNTSMNIPKNRTNDLESLHGKTALRQLRGVQKVTLVWCLKSNGARIYKRNWTDVAKWSRRLQVITLPKV